MDQITRDNLIILFGHQMKSGYLFFVDGEPTDIPRKVVQAIEEHRQVMSIQNNKI